MPSGTRHELRTTSAFHRTINHYDTPTAGNSFSWEYSPDRDLWNRTEPGGPVVQYTYDEGYRITSAQYDSHMLVYSYTGGSEEPSSVRRYTGGVLDSTFNYTQDGALITDMKVSIGNTAEADADFSYSHTSALWLSQIVSNVLEESFTEAITRNEIGHISSYGDFSFSRRSDASAEMTDGTVTCVYRHDGVGFLSGYSCDIGGTAVFSYDLARQNDSSTIVGRDITIGGEAPKLYDYTYDQDGQLTQVDVDGVGMETYSYDMNGNRESWASHGSSHTATYDNEDKVIAVDDQAYTHTTNGFISSTRPGVTFTYNSKGELEEANIDGNRILYRYDGFNRLIQRTSGESTLTYFYGDPQNQLRPSHIAKGDEVYALYYNDRGMNIAMRQGDTYYYVMCDHLGSPIAVFDSSGTLIKEVIIGVLTL